MTCRRGDGVPADASPGRDAIDATFPSLRGRQTTRVDGARTPLTNLLRLGLRKFRLPFHRVPFLRLGVDGFSK